MNIHYSLFLFIIISLVTLVPASTTSRDINDEIIEKLNIPNQVLLNIGSTIKFFKEGSYVLVDKLNNKQVIINVQDAPVTTTTTSNNQSPPNLVYTSMQYQLSVYDAPGSTSAAAPTLTTGGTYSPASTTNANDSGVNDVTYAPGSTSSASTSTNNNKSGNSGTYASASASITTNDSNSASNDGSNNITPSPESKPLTTPTSDGISPNRILTSNDKDYSDNRSNNTNNSNNPTANNSNSNNNSDLFGDAFFTSKSYNYTAEDLRRIFSNATLNNNNNNNNNNSTTHNNSNNSTINNNNSLNNNKTSTSSATIRPAIINNNNRTRVNITTPPKRRRSTPPPPTFSCSLEDSLNSSSTEDIQRGQGFKLSSSISILLLSSLIIILI